MSDLGHSEEKINYFSKKDSLNHLDSKNFNLEVTQKDTIINNKKYFLLKLNSNNLRNNIKYFINYDREGIFLCTISNSLSQEKALLKFNTVAGDLIPTLYGRFEFFQLIKESESDYKFSYIQDPYKIELYYMYGDKIVIKNKDDKKINLILFYHDKYSTYKKEIEIPFSK